MITTNQIDNVLQNIYLDVIGAQIDKTTSPFFNMIEKSAQNVYQGKVKVPARMGITGSVACGSETGSFPAADNSKIVNFEAELCNIYGTMQITDKALRCSKNTPSDAINLFQNELESLVNSAKYNFNRMLMGNGTGELTRITSGTGKILVVEDIHKLTAGMVVDIYNDINEIALGKATIMGIDISAKTAAFDVDVPTDIANGYICVQGSKNNELLGVEYLFNNQVNNSLYGIDVNVYPFFKPTTTIESTLTCDAIQNLVDLIEEKSGSVVDFIICSYAARRAYLTTLASTRTNIDYLNLDGGFKALSYNGIPVYADKFVSNKTMYCFNTKDFVLAQLGDWDWITGVDGHILVPAENTPDYVAHLAKYANLICKRPYAQGKMNIN
ncbi:MAG: phage major capsid protein [Clostridia bacterium]